MTGNRPIDPKPATVHDIGGLVAPQPTNTSGETFPGSASPHSPASWHVTAAGCQPHGGAWAQTSGTLCGSQANPAAWHQPGAGNSDAGAPAMSVLASGAAVALGVNTTATGEITNQLVQRPGVTVGYGEVLFTATASSPVGGPLAAITGANVDANGADYVFEFVNHSDGHTANSAWSQSDLQFVAIDIANWRPPGGQTVVTVIDTGAFNHWRPGSVLSGNVASLTADALTLGPDTSTSTLAQTMTVQHFMSVASGYAFTIG